MFENLINNFGKVISKLTGAKKITNSDLDEVLGEIKSILIDSDVALSVVNDFIIKIRTKALGQEVIKSVTPGQMIIKIINDELITLLSSDEEESEVISFDKKGLTSIMMVGLQGSGKTTSSAKLASWLKNIGKKVLLISLDVYRAAARKQLSDLANRITVDFFTSGSNDPLEIANSALNYAQKHKYDVAIFDTAGRLQIDSKMIDEVKQIKSICNPREILLVIDSLAGQDAARVASKFHNELHISGTIPTRVDADNKGGAILSVKAITGKPIKFLGVGEKADALEAFNAERIADRILGKGDISSLVEEAKKKLNQEEAEKTAKRLQQGKFDLNDYLEQIRNINKLGGASSIMQKLPGFALMSNKLKNLGFDDASLKKQEAIICSMTKEERRFPECLNMSRKKRIASGAGVKLSDVEQFLKGYFERAAAVKVMLGKSPNDLLRGFPDMNKSLSDLLKKRG